MPPTTTSSTGVCSVAHICRFSVRHSQRRWPANSSERGGCRFPRQRFSTLEAPPPPSPPSQPRHAQQLRQQQQPGAPVRGGILPTDREYLRIPDNELAYRWETTAPTARQLKSADVFFQAQQPKFKWSAARFQTIGFANAPEVAFLGRSNVGKSSLLNALLGNKICHTSSKPGRTRTMNAFDVHGGRLVVVDMPGYGKGSRDEWGTEILKYLTGRKALRRAFLLIDSRHGLKTSDAQLLRIFRQNAIPHQIIVSKVDRILFPSVRTPSPNALAYYLTQLRRSLEALRPLVQPPDCPHPPALGEILSCSAEHSVDRGGGGGGRKLGVAGVRWAMLAAAGLEDSYTFADLKTAS